MSVKCPVCGSTKHSASNAPKHPKSGEPIRQYNCHNCGHGWTAGIDGIDQGNDDDTDLFDE